MLKATYARDHLWREVVLHVRCGFTTCGEHLGHLTAAERDGARVWWVSVNQSFTQRQPGLWALSRHARRSRTHAPSHITRRPKSTPVGVGPNGTVVWDDNTGTRHWWNGNGEHIIEVRGWRSVLPPNNFALLGHVKGIPWDGRGRPPGQRTVARLVPEPLMHTVRPRRQMPSLAALTIACPTHGHYSSVTWDDVESEVEALLNTAR